MSIKAIVGGGNMAYFKEYRDGNLWYRVVFDFKRTGDFTTFDFPVPIEDAKGAVFPSDIKAITLMRWIRKHLQLIEEK